MAEDNRESRNRKLKRKRIRRMRRRIKRTVYIIAAGLVMIMLIGIFGGRKEAKDNAKGNQTEKNTNTEMSREETEEERKQRQLEEKQKQIEKVLSEDVYGEQLTVLYKKYPEVEQILLNRGSYPDWLIEYFVTHAEAVEWVVNYPEYMAKSADEINNTALETVDLKDYYVRRNIPIYYQWNLEWGYASYGNGTIAVEGCGPTCLSMVATGLTGDTSLTPKRVGDMSVASGYYAEEFGTDWVMMTEGAAQLGLRSNQIVNNWSVNSILAELQAGHPIICSMGAGDFTNTGHFVVLTGLSEDGKIILNDPNSKINTRKKWNPQTILDQMEGAWVFSVME